MIEIKSANDISRVILGDRTDATSVGATSALTITVRYLRAQNDGDTIAIGVELADKSRNLTESRRYVVRTSLFSALDLHRGTISQDKLAEIEAVASLSAAWQRGLSILAYGANSAHALTIKLRQRGFDTQTVTRAVELIRAQGYLHEDSDARREAERSLSKGWGLRRIGQYLRQRGYDAEAVNAALESLSNEDFDERCCIAARKYCHTPPTDAKQKQKIVAYLLRYGYDMSEVRHALSTAWEDEE